MRGNMGNMNKMMKQMQKMQRDMMKAQEELLEMTFEASSGGGMVKVVANGKRKFLILKSVKKLLIQMISRCYKI